MNRLLYYPYTTIENKDWLKFALLYCDKVMPIVPKGILENNLDKDYEKVLENTDLIHNYNPMEEEIISGVNKGIHTIQNVLNSNRRKKTVERWRQIDQTRDTLIAESDLATIYKGKYKSREILDCNQFNEDFEEFCISEGIAKKTHEGIIVNKDIGLIYMGCLADGIAMSQNLNTVTDKQDIFKATLEYNNSDFIRYRKKQSRINQIKRDIELNILPRNLSDIDIDTIIDLRNDNSFRMLVEDFRLQMDLYQQYMESIELDHENTNIYTFEEFLTNKNPSLMKGIISKLNESGIRYLAKNVIYVASKAFIPMKVPRIDLIGDGLDGAMKVINSKERQSINRARRFCVRLKNI